MRTQLTLWIIAICFTAAACVGTETEDGTGAVNVTPDNSQTYVRARVSAGPTVKGHVRVLRDSLGYIIDSDAIVVYPGEGSVTASVSGAQTPAFVLYAFGNMSGEDGDLKQRIGSSADGWTRVTINPSQNQITGVGASGNYQFWTLEQTPEQKLSWDAGMSRPISISFVPVPRYQLWHEIQGTYDYEVTLTCADASGRAVLCESFASPGTRVEVPARRVIGTWPSGSTHSDEGGYVIDAAGPTLRIGWRQKTWITYADPTGGFLIDSNPAWPDATSWRMSGAIESEGPPLEEFSQGENRSLFTSVMSPDQRRLEWDAVYQGYTNGDPDKHTFTVNLSGHDADPPVRYRINLQIDGKPADKDHIFLGASEMVGDTDGSAFFVYARP